jgi:spermidine synthase
VVPTYNGGFMALGWATDDPKLRKAPAATIARLYRAARLETRYFNPEMFAGAFALPNFIRAIVDGAAKPARRKSVGKKAR